MHYQNTNNSWEISNAKSRFKSMLPLENQNSCVYYSRLLCHVNFAQYSHDMKSTPFSSIRVLKCSLCMLRLAKFGLKVILKFTAQQAQNFWAQCQTHFQMQRYEISRPDSGSNLESKWFWSHIKIFFSLLWLVFQLLSGNSIQYANFDNVLWKIYYVYKKQKTLFHDIYSE